MGWNEFNKINLSTTELIYSDRDLFNNYKKIDKKFIKNIKNFDA